MLTLGELRSFEGLIASSWEDFAGQAWQELMSDASKTYQEFADSLADALARQVSNMKDSKIGVRD